MLVCVALSSYGNCSFAHLNNFISVLFLLFLQRQITVNNKRYDYMSITVHGSLPNIWNQHLINIDSTLLREFNVDSILIQRYIPAAKADFANNFVLKTYCSIFHGVRCG